MLNPLRALLVASFLAIGVHAQEIASPTAAGVPAHSVAFAASKAGDYLKFQQTQTANGQSQTLTMWQVHRAVAADSATVQVVLTNRAWTGPQPLVDAAPDVQIADQSVPIGGTLIDIEIPAGVELVSDVITKLPDESLSVGPRSIPCQVFERLTKVKVPEGEIQVRNRLWWSSEVPVSGLVQSSSETTGVQTGSTLLELVSFTGINDVTKIKVTEPVWFLDQAHDAIFESGANDHGRDTFLDDLGDGFLALGEFDLALETARSIKSNVYQESLVSALRAFAAVDDGPGQRELLELVEAEDIEREYSYFANVYSNYFERLTPEQMEPLVERAPTPSAKDALWSARFERLLSKGDADGARIAFERITTKEGRANAQYRVVSRAGDKRSLDPLALAAKVDPVGAEDQGFLGSQYRLLDDLGREKEALEVARRYVAAILKMPEAERAETITNVLTLALYRPWSRVEPFVTTALMAKGEDDDPEGELARAREQGTQISGLWSYAQRAAVRGDEAAAKRILAQQTNSKAMDSLPAIVALYTAGKKDEATAWARALAAGSGEQPFHAEGARTRIFHDFAAREFFAGDDEAETRWLAEAEKAAISAQQALKEFNRANAVALYWEGGVSMKSNAPFFLVGLRLVARGEHERALEFIAKIPSLWPGSGSVEDFWKYLAVSAGKRGDADFATKVVARLPDSIDANARNWFVRDVARAFALSGDAASGLKFIAGLKEEHQRKFATSSLIVQLCLDGKAEQAAAVFTPWIATQPAKQWGDARIAMAMAEAVAGRVDRARELFLADHFSTDFIITGLERQNVFVAVGYHAAKAKPDLDYLGHWLVGVKDATERAYLALGMAFGFAQLPIPDEFADPIEYSPL